MNKEAKLILVNLNVRVLVDPNDDETQIRDLTKVELNKLIENNEFEFEVQPDLLHPFSTKDAIKIALQELHANFMPINSRAEDIIKNRVKELLGDNFNEDDFTQEWHFDLLTK